MERNRDLRKATISTVNGLPRRRPKISALNLRDSTDMDRQMELQETLRLRDREQLEKKVRDREFAKRRRVDRHGALQRSGGGGGGGESYRENESTDSSDEEYFAEEEETRIHQLNRTSQLSPTSSSLSNSRSGLRILRSSPVVRAAGDEMLGVPVPRRARSGSAKRLQDYCNSGGVGGDDLTRRRFSSSPAIVGLTGSGSGSPSFSGASTKKMISAEPRTKVLSNASNSKPSSVIQDEIEIEVAEALFDLMKQSQSQSQSPPKVDGESADTAADDDLKRLKAAGGKDENNAFLVQNEQSIKVGAETTLADSVKELKKERRIDKEKFADDDPAQELVVGGDGFVNKGKVGSLKESESPSCVTVNACDIQDPIMTKADQTTIRVAAKKIAKLEIDLMAPPPLPSSSERDFLVDMPIDPKEITQGVLKKSDAISKDSPLAVATQMSEENIRVISSNRLPNIELEKRRHDIPRVGDSTTQQQQIRNDQKSQYATPLLSFPFGMNSWPSVLPRPGYMPPTMQAVLPIDGSARSSLTMQPPQFNFSQPRLKRCSTHQNIANNIQYHQQLIKKSLSSGPIGPPTLYGAKPSNLKSKSPRQKLVHGDFQSVQNFATTISDGSRIDKISDAAAAFNATANGKSIFQQANNFSHGSGLIFPNSQRQTTMTSAANSSAPASAVGSESLPSVSAGRLSVNLPLHGAPGSASFNQPTFPSMEAAPYMAMLQNNSFPNLPSFRGVHPNMPFFNSSLYSSPAFNVTQNQQQPLSLPHAPVQSASIFGGSSSHKQPKGNHQHPSTKISDDKFPYSSQTDKLTSRKSVGSSVSDGFVSQSVECNNTGQTYAFPVQAMNFAVMPPGNNKQHGDPSQHGSKGGMNMVPQAFALSFGSNASTTAALSFSSMMHNSAMMYQMAQQQQQQQQKKNFLASEGANQIHGGGQPFNFSKSDCSDSITARSTIPQSQQHQMQQQLAGGGASAYQVKAMNPVFTSSTKTGNSNFAPKWENYSQNNTNTALSNIPQLKSSQSSRNPVSPSANSSVSKNTNTGSSQRSMTTVSKSTQETEVPPNNGPAQKLSPACRRNVTPILGTCPTQLSELKY